MSKHVHSHDTSKTFMDRKKITTGDKKVKKLFDAKR